MTREDRRVAKRILAAVGIAIGLMWLVGLTELWLFPSDKATARCLARPMAEYNACIHGG